MRISRKSALPCRQREEQRVTTDLATLEHEQRQYASELGALQDARHEVARAEEQVRLLRSVRPDAGRSEAGQSHYEHCHR